jgi:VWFA-related protein
MLGVLCLPIVGRSEDRPLHQQQTPTFKAGTDLILIDTRVAGRDGTPVTGLKPEQFEVFIDGRRRSVASLDFVRADAAASAGTATGDAAAGADPRIVVIAMDEGSFPGTARAAAREAATRVVDRVANDVYLGMIGFPSGLEVPPSLDRAPMRAGIARIAGVRAETIATRFTISATEATLLKSRLPGAIKEITERECRQFPPDPNCQQQLIHEGSAIADALEHQGLRTIAGLHAVLDAIAPLPGRKTLMVISAGLPMSNRPGGRPNLDAETARIARRAAAVNVNLYVFYMNVHFLRYFSAEYGKRNNSIFDDISLFGTGLEKFADSGGGSFFQVEVDADPFVDRVLREISAFYLVGVRTEPADHDGKEHFIRVEVKQGGTTVRYRKVVSIPAPVRKE